MFKQENRCDFILQHYREILIDAKKKGYQIITFGSYANLKADKKLILLRHDVDLSPDYAREIAEIEKEEGVRSTFFFRVQGTYNILGSKTKKVLSYLKENQFEIGLHSDAGLFAETQSNLSEMLAFEKKILEFAVGAKILVVSYHLPKKSRFLPDGKTIRQCGFQYDAGEPLFNDGFVFNSDSDAKWKRDLCVCQMLDKNERIYLLAHPVWWAADRSIRETLREEAKNGF